MDKLYAIFDMDGTLVDSMGFWERLSTEFLTSRGVTDIPAALLEQIKPLTLPESAALLLQTFGLSGTAEEIALEMSITMDNHYRHDIPLKPGITAYLDILKKKGVTMCVASATPEPLMAICLSRLGIAEYFSFLLSCETVGTGKTQPDVFYEAARRLGAVPADTAVFEDAIYAVDTAKKAGFYTVAVQDECNSQNWDELAALAHEAILHWSDAARKL